MFKIIKMITLLRPPKAIPIRMCDFSFTAPLGYPLTATPETIPIQKIPHPNFASPLRTLSVQPLAHLDLRRLPVGVGPEALGPRGWGESDGSAPPCGRPRGLGMRRSAREECRPPPY